MLKLIFYRIAWFIPTILIVLGLTFFLVKLSPGDPVDYYLDTETSGIQSREQYFDQYNQTARFLGLDQPNFYFDLSPYQTDASFYELPYAYQKLAKTCLQENYSWPQTNAFLNLLIDFRANRATPLEDRLILEGHIHEQQPFKIIQQLSTLIDTETPKSESGTFSLESFIIRHNSVESLYIPKWHWHGKANQFHAWITGALTFDFGSSRQDGQLVNSKLLAAIRWTLCINLTSLLLAYLLAIPVGVYSGWYTNSFFDRMSNFIFTVFYAVPIFWMATIFVVFFTTTEYGGWTNIFPAAGIWFSNAGDSFSEILRKNIGQFLIPVFTLSTALLAYITRQIRGSMAEEKKAAYIFQARAKGLSEQKIIWSHAFKNASFPLITMLASILPSSIAGSLVLEIICNVPGIGRLLYDSIFNQDWPVLMGVVGITAWLTMIGLLISDIVYRVVDPRLQVSATE